MAQNLKDTGGTGKAILAAIVLAGVTVCVFWRVIDNDFVGIDDDLFVMQNRHVLQGLSWEGVKWAITEHQTDYWHPLAWMSHMLDVSLFSTWPGGHHLTSLALHTLNALLLFGFLRYATQRLWPSIFVAAVFALHPLRVESVAWAAERKDILAVLFFLVTIWLYAFYTRKPCLWRYLAVILSYLLGLMSKPMLVSLPVILLLLDYWPLERFSFDGLRLRAELGMVRRVILEKLPLLAMAAAVVFITIISQSRVSTVIPLSELDLPSRLTNATFSYWRYIQKMFWPANLAFGYPLAFRPLYVQAMASLAVMTAITIAVVRLGRQYRYLPVGWVWYVIVLIPVAGFLQVGIQSHADRYTYISLTGLLIIVAWGAADLTAARPRLRLVFTVLAAIALLAISAITWRNVGYWKDDLTLYNRAVTATKDNYAMLTCRAIALNRRGMADQAMADVRESLRIYPALGRTHVVMGALLLDKGRAQEAIEHCMIGVEVEPFQSDAQYNMALALMKLGRTDEAEPYCRQAIVINPECAPAYGLLGSILITTGHLSEAEAELRTAISLDPASADSLGKLAYVFEKTGRRSEAIEALRAALRIDPDKAALRAYLQELSGEY
jgi:tetratricopeptide (TPR) repeat protein